MKKKHHSENTKEKIALSLKGHLVSNDTKQKMRERKLGIRLSKKHKRAISLSLKGIKRSAFSEEHKRKLSMKTAEAMRNPVILAKISGKNNVNWISRGKMYDDWQVYVLEVRRITEKQPLYILKNFNKRGRWKYHLDHKIPISEGFKRKISVKTIGNIKNLQMLWWEDNLQKHTKIVIS